MAIADKTRTKIEKLLERFKEDKYFDEVTGPYMAVEANSMLALHSKNRFFLIAPTSIGSVKSKSLDGCIDGKWNVYVYTALEALQKFGLISEKERTEMRLHLAEQDRAACREREIENLKNKAKELGCSLTRNYA